MRSAQKLASARISSDDQTVPPGLCGLQKNTILVRGVSFLRERIEVHLVAALTLHQLRVEDAAVVGENDLAEGVIGRWKHHDLVARLR